VGSLGISYVPSYQTITYFHINYNRMTKSAIREQVLNVYFTFEYYLGTIRSIWIYRFRNIKRPAVFYGCLAGKYAVLYAHRRKNRWRLSWDGRGRNQCVIALERTRLVVCSEIEVRAYQKAGIMPKDMVARNIVKHAIYKTGTW